MSKIYINRVLWCLAMVLLQAFVLNRIRLFGYATPYLYVWFLLKLARSTRRNELMLWGFFMGLAIDVLCDTPGINAAAATLLAFARPYVLPLFTQRDQYEDFEPSLRSMHLGPYTLYLLYLLLLHHAVLFLLEFFSFGHPLPLLVGTLSSLFFTLLLMALMELFRSK